MMSINVLVVCNPQFPETVHRNPPHRHSSQSCYSNPELQTLLTCASVLYCSPFCVCVTQITFPWNFGCAVLAWYLQLYTRHHVSRVYTVAAVLCLYFVPLVLLFRMLDMFCTTSLVLSAICVCGAQYGCFLWYLDFVILLYISRVFYELFWHGSSCPCYYWHHFCFYVPPALNFSCKVFIF